jgi:hypothetical protein
MALAGVSGGRIDMVPTVYARSQGPRAGLGHRCTSACTDTDAPIVRSPVKPPTAQARRQGALANMPLESHKPALGWSMASLLLSPWFIGPLRPHLF